MFEEVEGQLVQMNKCCAFGVGKCSDGTHRPLCERKKMTDLLEIQRKQESHRFLILDRVETLNYVTF